MELLLCIISFGLFCVCILLIIKVLLLRKAAKEIRAGFVEKMGEDSNVGIDISSGDSAMCELAADINQQLKLFQEKRIQYERGDLELKRAVTNISHDLRTPLTAISGYVELLQKEELSEDAKRYVMIIEQRINALKSMTEELFQYSVILSDDICGKRERLSLNFMLEESIAQHYGALKMAGIEPEIDMPEQNVYVETDTKALSRVLQNIISNAIKYSDGDFVIRLERNGIFSFQNHAAGLDEVQVGYLFDRFYTVESGRSSTGLGLSIAKTLIEELGGKIDAVYVEGVLKISIILPVHKDETVLS